MARGNGLVQFPAYGTTQVPTQRKFAQGGAATILEQQKCLIVSFPKSQLERVRNSTALLSINHHPVDDQIDF